ncbi:hypothetical protein [Alkalibaculum bacchi]|uniref:hypothetical protein n=1 Tax=Alkalibaculum bacchi TaxID=645887 RepID=UPI0026F2A1CD|nr:hypothetical protein [Alkalibaculum bacchi]
MIITYEVNKSDFLDFHCKYIFSLITLKKYIKYLYIVFSIVFFICFTIAFSMAIRIALICMIIAAFLTRNFLSNMYKRKVRRNLLRVFNSDIYKNTFSKTELLLTEKSIQIKTDYATKIFLWEAIYDLHLIDNYLIIRTLSDEIIYVSTSNTEHLKKISKLVEVIMNYSNLELNKNFPNDLKYKGYIFF